LSVQAGVGTMKNQSKTLIPQSKNQIFQKFLTYFPKSSYENHEPVFENFFRIKNAGSSNYRGAAFFASARHGQKALIQISTCPLSKWPIVNSK